MKTRARTLAATAILSVLALAGCSLLGDGPTVSQSQAPPTSRAAQTPPPGSEALATFYGQRLSWSGCGVGECADLTVPVDYAKPAGGTTVVKLLRMRATRQGSRIGSLVVNPGGPGGSGVQYARGADSIVGRPVRQRFDIVGFDPRGVGRSAPIDCLDDRALDQFLGTDPTPDDAAEEQGLAAEAQRFADGCRTNAGPLLGHVSTEDAAKDMDILRAALGDEKLNYLGKSYGTYLGATYAGLFPKQVGQFVLDGVVAPDLTSEQVNEGQAGGFERATRAWAAQCVDDGCPLGDSVDQVMQGMRDFLASLDAKPLPVSNDTVTQLTEAWGAFGVAEAMYDQRLWGTLTDAMRAAVEDGNGSPLMKLANSYARRTSKGQYTGNVMEVIYAVNCLDKPDTKDLATYEQRAVRAEKVAPTWGQFLAWSSLPCGFWPIQSGKKPTKITAEGSGPIVVVGTTRDPATPYEWSVQLNDQLANSALVTFDGDGHTAYKRSNSCVDNAINDYYTRAKVPRDGLKC